MQVFSNTFDSQCSRPDRDVSGVVEVAKAGGSAPALARFFPETERGSREALRQFHLHRTLRLSGIPDADDLIIRNKQVVGYTIHRLPGQPLPVAVGHLDDAGILKVLRDIAFAALSLHTLGLVHGDIAPNNIWVNYDGHDVFATLLDLGFTSPMGTRSLTEMRGTMGFVAPEPASASPAHAAWDAFSFGKIVEYLIPRIDNSHIRNALGDLVLNCTNPRLADRRSDFGDIYYSILCCARAHIAPGFGHSAYSVPLRIIGMTQRVRSMVSRIRGLAPRGLLCCYGAPGSGKSELIRAVCHVLQEDGEPTLRISAAADPDEVIDELERRSDSSQPAAPGFVFVETEHTFQMRDAVVSAFKQLVNQTHAVIVLECCTLQDDAVPRGVDAVRTRELSARECMSATSHLLVSPSLVACNGELLVATTGGNPRRIRGVMTDYFTSGRRARGEPIELNRTLTGSNGASAASKTIKSTRSLRAAVGNELDKLRLMRSRRQTPELDVYSSISRGFGDLGSIKRRVRWARMGIEAYRRKLSNGCEESLENYIRLAVECMPPDQRITEFQGLDIPSRRLTAGLSAYVKSEIGAAYLYLGRPELAVAKLQESAESGRMGGAKGAIRASILNRLGTAKMLLYEFGPAKKYLTEADRLASQSGDQTILARVTGNLGLLALYTADPNLGLATFRRHRRYTAAMQNHSDYLSSLLNETTCLVDLGKSASARRRAELSLYLAHMLSDDFRLGHARNNLGWLALMRCDGLDAMRYFQQALVVREKIGHALGLATTHMNLARLHILARRYQDAESYLEGACSRFEALVDTEGIWDCRRLAAKLALMREDYDEAARQLDAIPIDAPQMPEKDRADVWLLLLERALWLGDENLAVPLMERVNSLEAIARVQHLSARRLLLAGFHAMNQDEMDSAQRLCGDAAEQFRRSDRADLLLDASTVIALLAQRVGNIAAGQRYLAYITRTTANLNEDIKCATG